MDSRHPRGPLAAWLLFLALAQTLALGVLYVFFVRTVRGQFLDTAALVGNAIGRDRVDGLVTTVLDLVTVLSLAVAIIALGFIALARRRVVLAMVATFFVIGANVTTQFLKDGLLTRPAFVVDGPMFAGNSFPSGHTTAAASMAVALVLVVPPRLRGLAALLGTGYAALTGVATLSAGWHRPSDAVGALLVVGAWAAAAGFVLVVLQHPDARPSADDAHPFAVTLLVFAGVVLLAISAAGMLLTAEVMPASLEDLSRRRLFAAYAGSAAGIGGTSALVTALALASVHRVVPRWRRPSQRTGPTRAVVGGSSG